MTKTHRTPAECRLVDLVDTLMVLGKPVPEAAKAWHSYLKTYTRDHLFSPQMDELFGGG